MNENLEIRCREFIENRDTLKRVFRLENSYLYPVCANIFCTRGVRAEEGRLRQCDALLKANMGIFSNFRGTLRMPVVSMLAVMEAPDLKIKEMGDHYRLLKQYFFGSQYLALVAMLLTETEPAHPMGEVAARGRTVYDRMKKEHPFLTSSEDSVFAVMMAFSEKDNDALINDMEGCYQALRARFTIGNALQSVSHVLALSNGAPEEKAGRVIDLYNALRGADVRYGRDYELATLAALAEMDENIPGVAAEVTEVYEYLSTQRGYGFFGPGKAARAMHAAMIVSDQYSSRGQIDTAAMTGTLAMMIAQEMAMCAVMVSASASSAAASSSSH